MVSIASENFGGIARAVADVRIVADPVAEIAPSAPDGNIDTNTVTPSNISLSSTTVQANDEASSTDAVVVDFASSTVVENQVGVRGFGKGLVSSIESGGSTNVQALTDRLERNTGGADSDLLRSLVLRQEPSQFLALNLYDGNRDGRINTKDALLRYEEIAQRFGRTPAVEAPSTDRSV